MAIDFSAVIFLRDTISHNFNVGDILPNAVAGKVAVTCVILSFPSPGIFQ